MIKSAACLGFLLVLAAPSAMAQMQIHIEGATNRAGVLKLGKGSRISDAALAAQVQPRAYMLGAAWLRPSLQESQQRLKAGVLFDLDSLRVAAQQHDDANLAQWSDALRRWIAALPVTGRMPALLDPRAVEAQAEQNRPLADGDHLFYPPRPTTVRIVGAVRQPCTLPLQPLQDARNYLSSCPVNLQADRDWIYVVQPDGNVFRQGIALWNRSAPLSLAPGAWVYVPLRAHTAQAIDPTFNEDLARFLATQVLPGPEASP